MILRALDLRKLCGAMGIRTPDLLHAIPDSFVWFGRRRSPDLRLRTGTSPVAPDSSGCRLAA